MMHSNLSQTNSRLNVLLAHGSSDTRHGDQVRALAADVSGVLGETVEVAFLSEPQLPKGACVLPLFLGEGKHGGWDAPKLAEDSQAVLLPSLAAHADAIAELAFHQVTAGGRRVKALFGLYRFAGFEALAAALHGRNKRCTLVAQGALHSEPSVASVLARWNQDGVTPVKLQPMLLFDGRSMDEMAAMVTAADVEILPVLSQCPGFPELLASILHAANISDKASS